MGAWSFGIFDDDTAYEFTGEIKNDAKSFFKASFELAINSDYLEFTECHAVTVSAAYIDCILNGTKYRIDSEDEEDESNINLYKSLNPDIEVEDLKELAIKALQKVISKNSELNELWEENEESYPKWKGNIEELINRLK